MLDWANASGRFSLESGGISTFALNGLIVQLGRWQIGISIEMSRRH
jgi:hypothetical protein